MLSQTIVWRNTWDSDSTMWVQRHTLPTRWGRQCFWSSTLIDAHKVKTVCEKWVYISIYTHFFIFFGGVFIYLFILVNLLLYFSRQWKRSSLKNNVKHWHVWVTQKEKSITNHHRATLVVSQTVPFMWLCPTCNIFFLFSFRRSHFVISDIFFSSKADFE